MKNIMFIAPPAAGKGTQADLIVSKYKIPHISTGDILREISMEESEIGSYVAETLSSGGLVKDEITYKLIEERLRKDDCKNGFVIDGFPRNIEQAIEFDNILDRLGYKLDDVFLVNVDKEIIEKRITGRRICENCKSIYNINDSNHSPQVESICDVCGGSLYQRKDDNIEAFNNRYKLFIDKTLPVAKHYTKKGILYIIDGNDTVKNIFNKIDSIISGDDK